MKAGYPQFKVTKNRPLDIEWVGDLHVKPELPVYTVSINYRGPNTPLVKIIQPQLVSNPPHFYKQSQSLCLYHPNNFKWKKEKLISRVIVPWTVGWIYFYEVWLETGIWYGPDAHNNSPLNKDEI